MMNTRRRKLSVGEPAGWKAAWNPSDRVGDLTGTGSSADETTTRKRFVKLVCVSARDRLSALRALVEKTCPSPRPKDDEGCLDRYGGTRLVASKGQL